MITHITLSAALNRPDTSEPYYEYLKPLCDELRNPIRRYLHSFYDLPEDADDVIAPTFYAEAYEEPHTVTFRSDIVWDIWRFYASSGKVMPFYFNWRK